MERLDDRYDLVETVSGHGRGQVIKAWDRERARHVALKVFRIDDDEQRERVLLEAELLMRVPAHPNLAVIVDELLVEQTYALVHDWVDGPDLAVVLRSSGSTGLPLDEVLRDIGQVAAALDHLHAQRPAVVHGDVKPANVVRAFGGRVVLVDFGSSVLEGGRGRSGTPGYAAPELQRGDGMTPASDVYGLTATVVTLLSGESPSGAAPSLDGLNVDVAASVAAVLRAGMADDPRLRPASAGALVEQLRRAADPATRPDRRTAVLAVVADGSSHTGEDGRSHPGRPGQTDSRCASSRC